MKVGFTQKEKGEVNTQHSNSTAWVHNNLLQVRNIREYRICTGSTRRYKTVLSLPETIKQNLTFRAMGKITS